MKIYNTLKIFEEARGMGISPYLLFRRKLNYRKGGDNQNCKLCQNRRLPLYQQEAKTQCDVIGISLDYYAQIQNTSVCDCFAPMEKEYEDV